MARPPLRHHTVRRWHCAVAFSILERRTRTMDFNLINRRLELGRYHGVCSAVSAGRGCWTLGTFGDGDQYTPRAKLPVQLLWVKRESYDLIHAVCPFLPHRRSGRRCHLPCSGREMCTLE